MRILDYLGRGIAHERQDLPCQDVIGYEVCENGNTILALADGAGGAKYAREAAQANVDAVIGYFRKHPAGEFRAMDRRAAAGAVIDACLEGIRSAAVRLGADRRGDLSATLLFALWSGTELTLGHLGDGLILVQDREGGQLLYSPPERSQTPGSGTFFTVSEDAAAHLRLYRCGPDRAAAFLLTSDGAYRMLKDRGGGRAASTAGALLGLAREGKLRTSRELAQLLFRITLLPSQRLDDWSFLICCPGAEAAPGGLSPVISMLGEEYERVKTNSEEEQN